MNDSASFYISNITFSLIVLTVTFLTALAANRFIDVVFAGLKWKVAKKQVLARTRTIRSLLKNIIEVILFLLAFLIILSHWGINITPILTGAGILGLAISFGSQSLVKDFISGFFIISENQFNVGDKIKIANFEGEVEKITLRITVLRDKKGSAIYVPNSQITTVVKYKESPPLSR